MGQMTKSTLMHINAGGQGDTAGFGEARKWAYEGRTSFEAPVWQAIAGEVWWSGVGQPDAELVMQVNASAFNISEVLMESAEVAMSAADLGFVTLGGNMWSLNDYAKSIGCWVNENGTVTWDEHNPNFRDPPGFEDWTRRNNTELAIQQTLKFATALDLSTAAAMEAVYQNAPDVVDNAGDAAIAAPRNHEKFEDAVLSRQQIIEVSAGWSVLADPDALLGVDDLERAGGFELPGDIPKHLEELDLLIGAIGLTKAGPFIDAVRGEFSEALLGAIEIGAAAAGKKAAEVGATATARVLKFGERVLGVRGYVLFASEVAGYLAGKLAPDGELTEHPVVAHDGDTKAYVSDRQLAGIASSFYSASGHGYIESVADLAYLQRINGPPPGEDYVAQAKAVREDLSQWLEEHAHLPPDDPDRLYAEKLVAELNGAING